MEFVGSAIIEVQSSSKGRMGRKRPEAGDTAFKSKNLHAERRRREKLSDRLLTLRASVPIITNMNKATIIEDAITYIEMLQRNVKDLSEQLLEMEASSPEEDLELELNAAEKMKKWGIKEDVKVTNMDGNKLWIKIILEKRRGRFTRLVEAMNFLGYEFTDIHVTTFRGAILVSCCAEGNCGDMVTAHQASDLLLEIIAST